MADETPPEPITIEQARQQVRVDSTDDDAYLSSLIVAARVHIENYTGLVLTPREVVETARDLGRWIDLGSWPVREITSIAYADVLGADQPLGDAFWWAMKGRRPVRIRPKGAGWGVPGSWCGQPTPVTITVQAGFATPDDVPAPVRQAMLLMIDGWYSNRGDTDADTPAPVAALLRSYRLMAV
jgi:uncharacterized phiE125 gp8 family phage protein